MWTSEINRTDMFAGLTSANYGCLPISVIDRLCENEQPKHQDGVSESKTWKSLETYGANKTNNNCNDFKGILN